jgi:hypothetical protein
MNWVHPTPIMNVLVCFAGIALPPTQLQLFNDEREVEMDDRAVGKY